MQRTRLIVLFLALNLVIGGLTLTFSTVLSQEEPDLPEPDSPYIIIPESEENNDESSEPQEPEIPSVVIQDNINIDFDSVTVVPQVFRQTVSSVMSSNLDILPESNDFTITTLRQDGSWSELFVVPNYVIENGWHNYNPREVFRILIYMDSQSDVFGYLERTEEYDAITQYVPTEFIDFSDTNNVFADVDEHLFPWTGGQEWYKTQGWHSGNALDFQPVARSNPSVDFAVLASLYGRVDKICDDGHQATLRITHPGGRQTIYVHLSQSSVNNNSRIFGQYVPRGQYLGLLYNGTAGGGGVYQYNTACGRGTAFHLHFILPTRDMILNDFSANSISGAPFATKYRSANNRVDIVNATSWNFANSTHSWSAGNNVTWVGFADGGAVWEVVGSDPGIYSPIINVPASNFSYISLKMAAQADTTSSTNCGQIYFRRSTDTAFSEDRVIYFRPPDNDEASFLLDMAGRPNWNGTIVQLRLDPACGPNGAPDGVRINEFKFVNNRPPQANNDEYDVFVRDQIEISEADGLLNNDPGDPDGDPVTLSIVQQPSRGELTLIGDRGAFRYVPIFYQIPYVGEDTFVYRLTDPSGASVDATVTINIVTHDELTIYIARPSTEITDNRGYLNITWNKRPNVGNYHLRIDNSVGESVIDLNFDTATYCDDPNLCRFEPINDVPGWAGFQNGGYTIYLETDQGEQATLDITFNVPPPTAPINIRVEPNQGRPTIVWSEESINWGWFNLLIARNNALGQLEVVHNRWYSFSNATYLGTEDRIWNFDPDVNLTSGDYSVYMRFYGPAGLSIGGIRDSGWGGPGEFTLPAGVADAATNINGTVNGNGQATITWTGANWVTWYEIWVGTEPDEDSDTYDTLEYQSWALASTYGCENAGTCTYTPNATVTSGTTYAVWMRTFGPGGVRDWQRVGDFTTP